MNLDALNCNEITFCYGTSFYVFVHVVDASPYLTLAR